MDGIVCSPVMNEPKAARSTFTCETAAPNTTPMAIAMAKPTAARRTVTRSAVHSVPLSACSRTALSTSSGGGRTNSGRQPLATTASQSATAMPMAASFGQAADHTRRARGRRPRSASSRASRPASSWSSWSSSRRSMSDVGMAPHLHLELVRDLAASAETSGESMRRGRSMSTENSLTTLPGRLDSSATRSASRAASRTLWVTKTTLRFRSAHSRSSSACSRSRVMASRAPKGSSMRRMSASWAKARAMATRWRMPPESSCGRLSPKPWRWTVWRRCSASLRRSFLGIPRSLSASSMFARTVSQGNSAASWKIRATRPRRSMVPADGVSRSAMRFSRVLLPHPDAPTRQRSFAGLHVEGDPVEGVDR